jgi:anti-sigma B factor antagonist
VPDAAPAPPTHDDCDAGEDEPLRITARHSRTDTTELLVDGEIDLATTPVLLDIASAALRDHPRILALNLHKARYVSSTGIAALLTLTETARVVGSRLCLIAPTRQVRRTLNVAGFIDIFDIHDSLAAAIPAATRGRQRATDCTPIGPATGPPSGQDPDQSKGAARAGQ